MAECTFFGRVACEKPFSDSVACVYRLGKHSLTNWLLWADEDCRRLDGAVGVARPSLTDYQKQKRSISDSAFQSVLCLKLKLALSGSGVKAPATDGQVEATTLGCHITWQPLQEWRRDATTVNVFMPDGAVKGYLLELTTWDKFERSLARWRYMVVSDSFGCWDLQHKERAIPTLALEDTECSVIVLARTLEAAGWAPFTGELVHTPNDVVS